MGTYGSIDNAFAPVLEDDSHDMINEDFKFLSFELCGYDVIDYQCADPIELESLAPASNSPVGNKILPPCRLRIVFVNNYIVNTHAHPPPEQGI
jgi:hypothetical protein